MGNIVCCKDKIKKTPIIRFPKNKRRESLKNKQKLSVNISNDVADVIGVIDNNKSINVSEDTEKKKLNSVFNIIKIINRGSFGKVYLVINNEKEYALKSIDVKYKDATIKEYDIVASLKHNNIISYDGYHVSKDEIYIYMKYAKNGTIKNFFENFVFNKDTMISGEKIKDIFKKILFGLIYMHKNDVIHMDIKPQNILMYDDNPVISDFGTCVIKSERYKNRKTNVQLHIWHQK